MLGFDDALRRVLDGVTPLGTEEVALAEAHGRVLAEPLVATSALPPFDYSAMDGYAVEGKVPSEGPLPVVGESRTGYVAPRLAAGTACRIFTGAPIPEGAGAVVMQENVERVSDTIRIRIPPKLGENVRRAGEDLPAGSVALTAGTRLSAYALGLVAALDRARVPVVRRPRVTIVCTGDELRAPGSEGRPGSIPESNSVVLAALCREAGAAVRVADRCTDDLEATTRHIAAALEDTDVLLTVGGVSVGDYDVVRPALEANGAILDFYKVAIKPGKPLTLGRRDHTRILGLPGNPASAQITFTLFGVPLLRALQGETVPFQAPVKRRLTADVKHAPGRRGFYAARATAETVTALRGQSSGSTVSLALANALLVLPDTSTGLAAGEEADVIFLGGGG